MEKQCPNGGNSQYKDLQAEADQASSRTVREAQAEGAKEGIAEIESREVRGGTLTLTPGL